MRTLKTLLTLQIILVVTFMQAQSQEFAQHWSPGSSILINHIEASSPCRLFYDVSNHPGAGLDYIKLQDFENHSTTFWILVAQVSPSFVFSFQAMPASGYTQNEMADQISAMAFKVESTGCPCDYLDELEQTIVEDDQAGTLSLTPVSTLTHYLIRVTATDHVDKIYIRQHSEKGDLKIGCGRGSESSDPYEIITWVDESNLNLNSSNLSCGESISLCNSGEINVGWNNVETETVVSFWLKMNHSGGTSPDLTFTSNVPQNFFGSLSSTIETINLVLYQPGSDCSIDCNDLNELQSATYSGTAWNMPTNWISAAGTYLLYVELELSDVNQVLNIEYENVNCDYTYPAPEICEACLPQFVPEAGNRYVIGAWVRELQASGNALDYENTYLQVSFVGSTQPSVLFYPEGQIIDGWQRIEGIINYPSDATSIQIEPGVLSGESLIDDIRFFPYDGSMKSYVYDPVQLRFVAELDERNFATFYEYDEEGRLMRIKKETERGVMTIQESKSSNVKKENYGN